jgi:sugar phosphate isomerase/epimerase
VQRALCIAAGMLTDVADPIDRIRIAADAGYDGLGLRVDEAWHTATDLRAVRDEIDAHGLLLLDVELVMLTSDDRHDAQARRAIEVAAALGSRHLVTVCFDEDPARRAHALGDVVRHLEGTGVRPVVEFLPFSSIPTLDDARRFIADAGVEHVAGVLVDVLHLARSGTPPSALADVPGHELPYIQVCDAGPRAAGMTRGDLFREATGERLLPGDGVLPVLATVAAAPDGVPLSVEVLSEELMRRSDPRERARAALDATRAMLRGRRREDPAGGSAT